MTIGVEYTLCTEIGRADSSPVLDPSTGVPIRYRYGISVNGKEYEYTGTQKILAAASGVNLTHDWHGQDLTRLFANKRNACSPFGYIHNCTIPNPVAVNSSGLPGINQTCPSYQLLSVLKRRRLYFTWEMVNGNSFKWNHLVVYNGVVLNLTDYFVSDKAFLDPTVSQFYTIVKGSILLFVLSRPSPSK